MFKLKATFKIEGKKPYETWVTRKGAAAIVEKLMFAFPNDEIDNIKIVAAAVDVFPDTQQAGEAKGAKDGNL